MKYEQLITFIRQPELINDDDLLELQNLTDRYPYFQAIRILYLKALYSKAGNRFRNELKRNTIHITDHKQLFRYLNLTHHFEFSTQNTTSSTHVQQTKEERQEEEIIQFIIPTAVQQEKRGEYAQTAVLQETPTNDSAPTRKNRFQHDELIQAFIETGNKRPVIHGNNPIDNRDLSENNPYQEELFSETLAKIYVRQHLYEKAIATYLKLSLKYPEKSIYFADQIEKIKANINN